jgi:hypothetical protein
MNQLVYEGARGQDVVNIQRALNYQMPDVMPALSLDGIFGPKTKARLILFQNQYDLKPDGIVGPKSRVALLTIVSISHHLLPRNWPMSSRIRTGFSGGAPSPSLLPPLPRLQLSYPQPFTVPLFLQVPPLRWDPHFLFWLQSRPFEIGAGTKMVFQKGRGEGEAFLDVTAKVWSCPPSEHLDVGVKTGVAFETRIRDAHTETGLVVIAGVEVKDVLKLGAVDVAKLQVEAEFKKSTAQKPPDMTATVKLGPSIETKDNRFSFGAGGYLELGTNLQEYEIKGGVFIEGAYHF